MQIFKTKLFIFPEIYLGQILKVMDVIFYINDSPYAKWKN